MSRRAHTHTYTHTHMCTHACMHVRTHTCTRHTCTCTPQVLKWQHTHKKGGPLSKKESSEVGIDPGAADSGGGGSRSVINMSQLVGSVTPSIFSTPTKDRNC